LDGLLKLAKRAELQPDCLTLTELDKTGSDPVDGGSFGDLWKGKIRGELVAVKVVKLYVAQDVKKLIKVTHPTVQRGIPEFPPGIPS
jgi:hypothetical protein